jgi:hypothetical protein
MCHAFVDAKTLERETLERLRATRPALKGETPASDGPPPELMGGIAGVLARLRAVFRHGRLVRV